MNPKRKTKEREGEYEKRLKDYGDANAFNLRAMTLADLLKGNILQISCLSCDQSSTEVPSGRLREFSQPLCESSHPFSLRDARVPRPDRHACSMFRGQMK